MGMGCYEMQTSICEKMWHAAVGYKGNLLPPSFSLGPNEGPVKLFCFLRTVVLSQSCCHAIQTQKWSYSTVCAIGLEGNMYYQLHFRTHQVMLIKDIQEAFLQVSIWNAERGALLFMWYVNQPESIIVKEKGKVRSMARISFRATCSSFFFTATTHQHPENASPDKGQVAKILSQTFYIDGLVTGANPGKGTTKVLNSP